MNHAAPRRRKPQESNLPHVGIKVLHGKIGELALENDFLAGARICSSPRSGSPRIAG
jgi:hypothetical protein